MSEEKSTPTNKVEAEDISRNKIQQEEEKQVAHMNRLYGRIDRLEEENTILKELLGMERGKILQLEDALYTVKERECERIDELESIIAK